MGGYGAMVNTTKVILTVKVCSTVDFIALVNTVQCAVGTGTCCTVLYSVRYLTQSRNY